ncbi:hypothetical protein FLONG3_7834 [Fusarium longipes]|uniref:Transcription factor domain-containing protein n=1 Tax=Fusarium longipes TaxID=694270 RepID=A0A395S9X5_9HYPO|nr:hypothetical protein FLONG3_7834 [Fusarium longipes]
MFTLSHLILHLQFFDDLIHSNRFGITMDETLNQRLKALEAEMAGLHINDQSQVLRALEPEMACLRIDDRSQTLTTYCQRTYSQIPRSKDTSLTWAESLVLWDFTPWLWNLDGIKGIKKGDLEVICCTDDDLNDFSFVSHQAQDTERARSVLAAVLQPDFGEFERAGLNVLAWRMPRRRAGQACDYEKNIDSDSADVKTDVNAVGPNTLSMVYPTWHSYPYSTIACALLDPFDTLCESPERLRQLLKHLLFQSLHMKDASSSLLTDRTLFHALSLLLTLEANDHLPNYETLHHRGQVLESLKSDLSRPLAGIPSLQIITAILLLIGYEYRVQDTQSRPNPAATHIRGLEQIIQQSNFLAGHKQVRQIQRALFWQDIICSLANGTPRLLQLDNHDAFAQLREDQKSCQYFVLPQGFEIHSQSWPPASIAVLKDLNALCQHVESINGQEKTSRAVFDEDMDAMIAPIKLMEDLDDEGYPLGNSQANLEIRLVDLLSQTTRTNLDNHENLIYRACLFAAYLCTYRLSTGIWAGHFVPEKCHHGNSLLISHSGYFMWQVASQRASSIGIKQQF